MKKVAAALLLFGLIAPRLFQVTTIALLRKFQSPALAVGIT